MSEHRLPAESIGLDESCLTDCKLTLRLWAFIKKTIVLKIEADRTSTKFFLCKCEVKMFQKPNKAFNLQKFILDQIKE